jgi:hypothetical protein
VSSRTLEKIEKLTFRVTLMSNTLETDLGEKLESIDLTLHTAMIENKPGVVHEQYVKILFQLALKYQVVDGKEKKCYGNICHRTKKIVIPNLDTVYRHKIKDVFSCWEQMAEKNIKIRNQSPCPNIFFSINDESNKAYVKIHDADTCYKFEFERGVPL